MNIYMATDAVSLSEEVSQQGVLKPQDVLSQWESTEKFMGAEFLEQKQYSMYRQLRDASKRAEPVGPRCRLMCLVYIRCLFCEASGTSSIGCFVCDLHRFSIKLKWECETLENLVRVLQVHYENGLCTPPPRRLRYRTNLFVIWVWYKEMMTYCCVIMYLEVWCPVRVEIPKYNCYNGFYVNDLNDSLQLFFRLWRRMKL